MADPFDRPQDAPGPPDEQRDLQRAVRMTDLAWMFAGPVLLGVGVDLAFDWFPWSTVVGAALGLVGGFWQMAKYAKRLSSLDAPHEGDGP